MVICGLVGVPKTPAPLKLTIWSEAVLRWAPRARKQIHTEALQRGHKGQKRTLGILSIATSLKTNSNTPLPKAHGVLAIPLTIAEVRFSGRLCVHVVACAVSSTSYEGRQGPGSIIGFRVVLCGLVGDPKVYGH